MDGDSEISDVLELAARTFPAGTKVVVSIPVCPDCEMPADVANDQTGKCECGFDWKEWAANEYA